MIVTLNSDNPADALLIERLFAPAERTGCCGDRQMDLPGIEPEAPAVARSAPETVVTAPLPPFILPEPPAQPAEPPSVDSAGLPWDARIHSESKATVADGTWRKRRGVDPELVKRVEAELRGEPAVTEAPVSVPTPPPPAPAPEAPVTVVPADVPPPPTPVPAPAANGKTLADLSAAVAQGKVDILQMLQIAKEHGCQDIPALSNNPLALAAVIAHFDGLGQL